ncbi:DUF4175 family protein [Gaetbulibacter saemankumensis]|uniref:DUF4175 family protein n=1 Tax=Gaetbulibacter saemankumensis TaxID=311208 RepID=UPI00041ABB41|nr:DUF4175 family protein [Gaetbulibacter saemankumensis]
MNHFKNIQIKLEAFIRRYYLNQLIKGAILFVAIGLLYFLFTLFIEHMLWLSVNARTFLFWFFVVVELALLVKFILLPSAKLFKLQKGIDYIEASKIIGRHFPEVNDKLLNVLQLNNSSDQSELLLASIEQKSLHLTPVPFKLAVNFKANLKYLKYAAVPLVIILLLIVTGHSNWFANSYTRVVHYKTAFEKPAPFQFYVVNDKLDVVEGNDFVLNVRVMGEVIPEQVQIVYDNQNYFLKNNGDGVFEYKFLQLNVPIQFQLQANKVWSKLYDINIIEAPSLVDFQMHVDYPDYIKRSDDTLKGTGNAIVPEGTKITWDFLTESTDQVKLYAKDTTLFVSEFDNRFLLSKSVYDNLNYSITTSNASLIDYEKLSFNIGVVKDEYPRIQVEMKKDSLDAQSMYFLGRVQDDYGFSKLTLVYHPVDSDEDARGIDMDVSDLNVFEFVNVFPGNLVIDAGISYAVYFEVRDNDQIHSYKLSKSDVFIYRKRTNQEEEERRLKTQKESIKGLDKTLQKFNDREKELLQLSNVQKEKNSLNFNDKKKLESFLERQKQQDEMMKNFNKQLQDNINKNADIEEDNEFKEALKERLKENELQLEQDERLLEELKQLQDKINNEELNQKLDELAKRNKNKKRSLEQLVELMKRFYVEEKLNKLKEDLMKLAIDQEQLAKENNESNSKENQDVLNKEFEELTKELDELKKEGEALVKPIEVPQDKLMEHEIQQDQMNATQSLENKENNQSNDDENTKSQDGEKHLKDAQINQKKAAKKMIQMSQSMEGAMQAGGGDQMQEDVDMLRQILDNLVLFSLDQESLMKNFQEIEENHNKYATYLKAQNSLKEHFEHIDDSLFALSLRQPKLSENVNKEIGEVYFNIEKALEFLVEGQLYQGISKQQFTMTATNNLADFLSDVLDSMEEKLNMSISPNGKGDMQLPDIIMSQEELNRKMEEGMKQHGEDKGVTGESEEKPGKDGEKGKEGDDGSSKEGKGEHEPGGKDGLGGEDSMELLFEIYKRQQELRNQLEDKIIKEGIKGNAERLLRTMESVEMDLLNSGINENTLRRMRNLKHQLLKFQEASLEQGEDNKRVSEANIKSYSNSIDSLSVKAKQYFNTIEILNKQSLPLQPVYRKKVNEYFRVNND